MSDVSSSRYAADFHGLLSSVIASLGVLAIGLVTHEGIRRWKRDTIYWRQKAAERHTSEGHAENAEKGKEREISSEDLGFGNLYEGRSFLAYRPSPRLPRWPLQWLVQAFWLKEDWFAEHCGIDAACYIRFLRACWFFVVAQLLTTFPTLLTINLTQADDTGLSSDDLARASLSSLITTDYGRGFLWLQVLFFYWLCFSWMALIVWVGVGVLRHRRTQLAQALAERPAEMDARAGWRFRTVLISNIPSDLGLRDEQKLIEYFEQGLQYAPAEDAEEEDLPLEPASEKMEKIGSRRGLIAQVVFVRRSAELQAQTKRRDEALHQLEAAHVQLAKNVLHAVESYIKSMDKGANDDAVRLDMLAKALEPYLDRTRADHDKAVWEILDNLPRELLDPYQPMHRLRKRFKGQDVPAVDYWLLRFQILHDLVEQMRQRPGLIAPAATAFVTFRSASDARRACRHMPAHPTRLFAVKVRMAPDVRDIIWEKIAIVSFRSDVLRSMFTHILIWFTTLVWILPISLFVALVSLDNIAQLVPALARWLSENPNSKAVLTSLVPTAIVSIIAFFVPTLINQITMRVQRLFLVSKLHHRVGFRYYVWLQTNIVVLFSLGATVVKAVFTDPADVFAPDSVLGRIAAAFPAAAVFYVSWLILTMGLQNGFEIMLFGYAMIGANSARKAKSLRRRHEARSLRQMNTYWWQPQTLLALSIFNIFGLLNSLVICFALPYFTVSLLVLKSQFAHVYGRNFWESNGRNYSRFLRFSLDSLMIASIVFIAFFFINSQGRYGAAAIVMLVVLAIFKLVATRWYKALADALDITEADIYTGAPLHAAQDVVSIHLLPSIFRGLPFFRRLVIRVPAILLSSVRHIEKRASLLGPVLPNGRESRNSAATETRPMLHHASLASVATVEEARASAEGVDARRAAGVEPAPEPEVVLPLVQPHPMQARNDWPDHSASYEDPYFARQLPEYLWLPRDPLSPLDLNDAIEWRGRALVSTAGGDGQIWAAEAAPQVSLADAPAAAAEDIVNGEKQEAKASLYAAVQRPATSPEAAATSPGSLGVTSAQSRLSASGTERIMTAANVGAKAEARSSWALSPRSPSHSPEQQQASAEAESYFPPPRRTASSAVERLSRLVSSPAPATSGTISQAEALREEVLAELQDDAAASKKEEKATRADEAQEERKAAHRDSKRFFSRGSDTNKKSWLRRFADATDP